MTEDGIESFFASYADAFNRVDSNAIAKMYHLPCLTIRGDGSHYVFSELEEIETFIGSVAKLYHDEGNRSGNYDELSISPIGNECALATLKWTLRKEGGDPIREWRQSYNLIRVDGGWQILVSIFHR